MCLSIQEIGDEKKGSTRDLKWMSKEIKFRLNRVFSMRNNTILLFRGLYPLCCCIDLAIEVWYTLGRDPCHPYIASAIGFQGEKPSRITWISL